METLLGGLQLSAYAYQRWRSKIVDPEGRGARRMRILWALVFGFLLVVLANPAAAQTSTVCRFTQGPQAGNIHDYAPLPPLPIGAQCQDGAGSVGVIVASDGDTPQGGGSPYGGGGDPQGQSPSAPTGVSTVCYFTSGARAGSSQDYAPRPPLPIGTPCQDGAGSSGTVR